MPQRAASPDPVSVEGGQIAAAPFDDHGVRVFKGIPYAAAPVGGRRWRAPAAVEPWTGVLPSDRFAASCPQASMFTLRGGLADLTSEDCLYLNVWTPARDAHERLPVLVWLHGGAYVVGAGSEPRYDGAALARKRLVVVTLNYRLGAFGFLAHPWLAAETGRRVSGNYGLMDQISALEWVQRNISAFGGDPSCVAIGGNSSGATSVNILMASPLANGLFHRAIAHGGSSMPVSPPNDGSPLPYAMEERKGWQFVRSLGVRDIEELRSLPTASLLEASGGTWSTWAWNASMDGAVLPDAPLQVFSERRQNDVPLLLGWNANEGAAIGPATFGGDEESFVEQISQRFGDKAPDLLRLYPASSTEEERLSKVALAGDGFISYPSWIWALAQLQYGREPVFLYRFDHAPPVPSGYLPPGREGDSTPVRAGAFHGAELTYLFGTFGHHRDWGFTAEDLAISRGMQSYWAQFVASGDPNGNAGLPMWPAYDEPAMSRLHIAARGFRVLADTDRHRFQALGRLVSAAPACLSYRGMHAERWLQ